MYYFAIFQVHVGTQVQVFELLNVDVNAMYDMQN